MRAARTDKGVSAVGQVVSLKMMLEPPGVVARINDNLPATLRVLGFHRVTAGFDARKLCDKRRYEYILPAFAFDPEFGVPRRARAATGQETPIV
jgi:tRNA pseudouridine38-40 synthase